MLAFAGLGARRMGVLGDKPDLPILFLRQLAGLRETIIEREEFFWLMRLSCPSVLVSVRVNQDTRPVRLVVRVQTHRRSENQKLYQSTPGVVVLENSFSLVGWRCTRQINNYKKENQDLQNINTTSACFQRGIFGQQLRITTSGVRRRAIRGHTSAAGNLATLFFFVL
ncbi:hypothetical protein FF38_06724 [Lucilia cuprina]|uniref:Uncharacterized protein n=1 Tax=Lucilia cuprina TaxID=7375 RepID=A0A0L0C4X6_LUCCU|nr:hypothetical protein FF38_06724 [Lucilia cuprina]